MLKSLMVTLPVPSRSTFFGGLGFRYQDAKMEKSVILVILSLLISPFTVANGEIIGMGILVCG